MLSEQEFFELRSQCNELAAHLQNEYLKRLSETGDEQMAMLTAVAHIEVLVETGQLTPHSLTYFTVYMIRRSVANQRALVTTSN